MSEVDDADAARQAVDDVEVSDQDAAGLPDQPTSEDWLVEVDQIAGDPRTDAVSALDNSNDPSFPSPLVNVSDIRSGGPPPDGIPSIDEPRFQQAGDVDWLGDDEPVLSLRVGDETRAYPMQIMTWHELVNDTFGDVPVTVSFCPLCNSAVAYHREVGETVLDFGTSGRLYNSSLVMYDRQTESLWTHFNGTAVVGELAGTELELLAMQTVSWSSFKRAHPDALVLSRETGFTRDYGRNPYPGYDDVSQAPFLFDGDTDSRLLAKQRVVAIRHNGDSVAVVVDDLAAAGVIDLEVGGEVLTVWHMPGTASGLDTELVADGRDIGATGVFMAVVDGSQRSFERAPTGLFVDSSGSAWDILGNAVSGPDVGAQLTPIEHLDTFWFAIAAFDPDIRIVDS